MALSTRGKVAVGVTAAVVLAGAAFIGYRLLTREEGESVFGGIPFFSKPTCPLTGLRPEDESAVDRRVLAVKIENSPDARPQAGLAEADIVYEQEAEGGITRFNVLYQCQDAKRIGPIRSARPVDVQVLQQYGDPLFVHAGSVQKVTDEIEAAGIEQFNCNLNEEVCPRDPNRLAPHDVFTSTTKLRNAGRKDGEPPDSAFSYDEDRPEGGKPAKEIHLNFSPAADVFWRYRPAKEDYVRFHGDEPHTLEDGSQVSADNIVVLVVKRQGTGIRDPAGAEVPTFDLIGSGKLFVFRNGQVVTGTWKRDSADDHVDLLDKRGDTISLTPGTTWVELFPTDAPEPVGF